MSIALPGELNLLNMMKADPSFVRPLMPAKVDSVLPGTPAAEIGLAKGDKILAINGSAVDSYNEFVDQLGRRADMMAMATTPADSMKARTVVVVFGNDARTDTAQVVLTPELKLGFTVQGIADLYKPITREYGFFESIPAGIKYGFHVLALRRRPEVHLLCRGCQVAGRLRSHRKPLPAHVGLVHVLEDDSFPFYHPRLHEHPAHPRPGRWPRAVPALRDDYPS